jgi:hypothetical protein
MANEELFDTSSLSDLSGQSFEGGSQATVDSGIFNRSFGGVDKVLATTPQAESTTTATVDAGDTDADKQRGLTDKQLAGAAAAAQGAGEFVTGFMNLANTRRATDAAFDYQNEQLDDMSVDLDDYIQNSLRGEQFNRGETAFMQRMRKEALGNQLMSREIAKEQQRRAKQQDAVNSLGDTSKMDDNYKDAIRSIVSQQRRK